MEKAYASLNKQGEELCGDRTMLSDTPLAVLAVLSDGLGSGVKANILATISAKVAMTMLEGGATLDEVVETLGRTLPVCKIRQLAYSTFTIIKVDNTGCFYIAEFDNPPAFCFRDGKRFHIERRVRKIDSIEVMEASWVGKEGDVVVVVSDGVVHAGIGEMLDFGWRPEKIESYLLALLRKGTPPSEICRKLIETTSLLSNSSLHDDATVLVLQLRKRRSLTVAVGPPIAPQDDADFVRELMSESQKRIVCGGTTATLVARELGETLHVEIDSSSEENPPTARLANISLATEGIITLSTVLRNLQNHLHPVGSDGATQVTESLLDADEIRFLVGRALNPAHQNPDLPVTLSLKQQVIKDIAILLTALGKQVKVKYY